MPGSLTWAANMSLTGLCGSEDDVVDVLTGVRVELAAAGHEGEPRIAGPDEHLRIGASILPTERTSVTT